MPKARAEAKAKGKAKAKATAKATAKPGPRSHPNIIPNQGVTRGAVARRAADSSIAVAVLEGQGIGVGCISSLDCKGCVSFVFGGKDRVAFENTSYSGSEMGILN